MIKFPQNLLIDLKMDVSDEKWETWLKRAISKVAKKKQNPGLERIYAAIRVIAETELPPSAPPPKGPETDLLYFNHVTEHLQRAVKKGIILRMYTMKGNPAYRLASKSDRQLDLRNSTEPDHTMMQGVVEKCLKELTAGMSNFRRFSIDKITDYVRFSHKIQYDEETTDEYHALQTPILAGLERGVEFGRFQQFQNYFRIADEGAKNSSKAFTRIKVGASKGKDSRGIPDMAQEIRELFTKLKSGSQEFVKMRKKLNGIIQGPSENQDEGAPSPESLEKREISETLDQTCEQMASTAEIGVKDDLGDAPFTSQRSKRTIKKPERFNPEPLAKKPRKKLRKSAKKINDTLKDYFKMEMSYHKKMKRGNGRIKIFSDEETSEDDDEVVCVEEINKPHRERYDFANEYDEFEEKEDKIKIVSIKSVICSGSESEASVEDREESMEVVELDSSAEPETPSNTNEIRKTMRSMRDCAKLVRMKPKLNRKIKKSVKIPSPAPIYSKREEMVFITNPEKLDPFNLGLLLKMTDLNICDVDLVVKEQIFRAHRIVLAAQSQYFSNLFKKEPFMPFFTLDVDNPRAFQLLLNFLYKGHFGETVFLNPPSVYEFLGLADFFNLDHLSDYVRASLRSIGPKFDAQFGFKLLEHALLKHAGKSHFDSILALIRPIYGQIKNLPNWKQYSLNETYASIFNKFDQTLKSSVWKSGGNTSPILPKINGGASSSGNANVQSVAPIAFLFQQSDGSKIERRIRVIPQEVPSDVKNACEAMDIY